MRSEFGLRWIVLKIYVYRRVCEFNLQATLESSKDGKVMVSFKSLQRMDSIITEQTIRDVFERRYTNPLSVVSIRKHTFKANVSR